MPILHSLVSSRLILKIDLLGWFCLLEWNTLKLQGGYERLSMGVQCKKKFGPSQPLCDSEEAKIKFNNKFLCTFLVHTTTTFKYSVK